MRCNAFLLEWSQYRIYIHCPFSIIDKALKTSGRSKGKILPHTGPTFSFGTLATKTHGNVKTTSTHSSTLHSQKIVHPVGLKSKTSTSKTHVNDFSRYMFELLSNNKIPQRTAHHIAKHGWRAGTVNRHATATRHWLKFCEETKTNKFCLNLENILNFFHYCVESLHLTFQALISTKIFISVSRKLSSAPLSLHEVEIINKLFSAIYNENPPCKVKAEVSWDLKPLLDDFKRSPPNCMLSQQEMAGKLCLLLLICSGCRFCEILQFRLSCIESPQDGRTVIFHLPEPTKTFRWKNVNQEGLQTLTFKRIPGFKYICPVITLLDYLKMTSATRKGEDKLFILNDGRPAARRTLSRWTKNHLQKAGLGNKQLRSTRTTMVSTCVMNNLPLDTIALKIGWFRVDTLVKNYMRPIELGPLNEETAKNIPKDHSEALLNHWKGLPARIVKHQNTNNKKRKAFMSDTKRRSFKSRQKAAMARRERVVSEIQQNVTEQNLVQVNSKVMYSTQDDPEEVQLDSSPKDLEHSKDSDIITSISEDKIPVELNDITLRGPAERSQTNTPLSLGLEDEFNTTFWREEMSFMDPIISDICNEQNNLDSKHFEEQHSFNKNQTELQIVSTPIGNISPALGHQVVLQTTKKFKTPMNLKSSDITKQVSIQQKNEKKSFRLDDLIQNTSEVKKPHCLC